LAIPVPPSLSSEAPRIDTADRASRTVQGEDFERWFEGRSVLLVDEDVGALIEYQTWLGDAGAAVTTARFARQAQDVQELRGGEFDVAVVNVPHPASEEAALVGALAARQPACSLLIQSEHPSAELVLHVKRLRAGFLSKPANRVDFMFALLKLGDVQVPEPRALVAKAQKKWLLSRQLTRVLFYNLWSLSNEEIARALGVTLHTVQDYQQDLRRKTGARTKDGYLRRLLECAGHKPPS
jgi:DNA-binding NarL/FixJ family response regulator